MFDSTEKVDFSYPEGFQKAVDNLTFLPEEMRELMLSVLLNPLFLTLI